MHELPQLGKLERAYPTELVVIGVQSPKYPAEADPDTLRHAVQRYGIQHPVVNDPELRVWSDYAVNAWPTLVFISPDGRVIGRHAGEATFDALDPVMAQLIQEYEKAGTLWRGRVDIDVETSQREMDELSYPGKVLATAQAIFIADSGHHRIVVAGADGAVQTVIGDGESGPRDGDFRSARFNRPQGMALDDAGGTLYVADSENHTIRAVDLQARRVRTIAGTGEQARQVVRSGPADGTALSSPWDLVYLDGVLYIAMAGLHQIWTLDLAAVTVSVWAGTGHEAIRDGSRDTAWLAQPMGLARRGRELYVACAETQAVRRIDVDGGAVSTLVGDGLFAFGDEDGPAGAARLQHVQDVAIASRVVYIADTYNNKIKALDLAASRVVTYLGSGRRGALDGPGENARFGGPSGLSIHDGTLYIADTNNHAIRTADFESGHVRPFQLRGLPSTVSSD